MLFNRLMQAMKRVVFPCIPGMYYTGGTLSAPYSMDGVNQKVSVSTNSLNGSMGGTAEINGSFDFSSGKTSFEFKSRFDVMSGGTPGIDRITLTYFVQRSGVTYAKVEVTHYEDGKYRLRIFDKSLTFPAMYDTGNVTSIPLLITMVFDAATGLFSIKGDGSILTLSGDNTFSAASGYTIYAWIDYYGINGTRTADAQIVTSKTGMLHGEGKNLCGEAL